MSGTGYNEHTSTAAAGMRRRCAQASEATAACRAALCSAADGASPIGRSAVAAYGRVASADASALSAKRRRPPGALVRC
jgi:hypothetical protein